jgi:hypothetical protein
LTAPLTGDSLQPAMLSSRLLGELPLAERSPWLELRARAADPVSNFLSDFSKVHGCEY